MRLISRVIKKVEKENKGIKSSKGIPPGPAKRKKSLYLVLVIGIILLLGGVSYFIWSNTLRDTSSPLPKPRRNLSERFKKAKKKTSVPSLDTATASKTDSTSISLTGTKIDTAQHPSTATKEKVKIEKGTKLKNEKLITQSALAETTLKRDSIDLLQSQKKEVPTKNIELSTIQEVENNGKEKPTLGNQYGQKVDKPHQEEERDSSI